jgi:hypothetical protein
VTEPAQTAPPPGGDEVPGGYDVAVAAQRRGRVWVRFRWWLLGLTVLVNLVALLVSPVGSDSAGLLSDLTTGRVAWVHPMTFATDRVPGFAWSPVSDAEQRSTVGASVVWGTHAGLTYQADLSDLGDFPPDAGSVETGEMREGPDVLRTVRATARAAGRAPPPATYPGTWDLHSWANLAAFVLWGLVLFSLITGPQPRRRTKWGWFWLMSLPVGLGSVLLLTREAPWSARIAALSAPGPRVTGPHPSGQLVRHGGWYGFFTVLLVGGLLGALLREAHPWLLDHHSGGGQVWQVVDLRGDVTTVRRPR